MVEGHATKMMKLVVVGQEAKNDAVVSRKLWLKKDEGSGGRRLLYTRDFLPCTGNLLSLFHLRFEGEGGEARHSQHLACI